MICSLTKSSRINRQEILWAVIDWSRSQRRKWLMIDHKWVTVWVVATGIFQVLATAHTVRDYAHALNSGVRNSNLRPRIFLLRQWPLLVRAAMHHEAAPTAMISGGELFGREAL